MRLQLSMLFVPRAVRASFCAMKFISLVDLEHEKTPIESVPWHVKVWTPRAQPERTWATRNAWNA